MTLLSICIPTYNRSNSLDDCLNSILISQKNTENFDLEVCISDNSDNNLSLKVVEKYKNNLKIKYKKNEKNLGFGLNAIQSLNLANGKYSWMIGDDDIILPNSLLDLKKIFELNNQIDYFFINSYFLNKEFLNKFERPLNTNLIDKEFLKPMSNLKESKKVPFWDIIDPKISWDFLIGIFFSVFRTSKWKNSLHVIDKKKLEDLRPWSNFDNTCLHPKILCNAFKNEQAFFCSKPLSINLTGVREWKSLYEFIEIVRIPELLDYYRSQGLGFFKYIYCKNFSLRNFTNYFMKILIGGKKSGTNYVNIYDHVIKNLFYPNVYISIISFFIRKINFKKKQ